MYRVMVMVRPRALQSGFGNVRRSSGTPKKARYMDYLDSSSFRKAERGSSEEHELERERAVRLEAHNRAERLLQELEERELKRIEDDRKEKQKSYLLQRQAAETWAQQIKQRDRDRMLDVANNPHKYSDAEKHKLYYKRMSALKVTEDAYFDRSQKKFEKDCKLAIRKFNHKY